MNVSDAHQSFIEHLRARRRASATILAYGKDIDQLLTFLASRGKTQEGRIETRDLKDFMEKLAKEGYTPKSISRKTNSTKTFFRYLREQSLINDDPAASLQHPQFDTKPPRILSRLEYRALRDACRTDTRIAAIVELLLQTGIRIGELANLTVDDVHFPTAEGQEGTLTIKSFEGNSGRTVSLNRASEQALRAHLTIRPETENRALFVTKTGRPLLVRNIRTAIDRYFRHAGIEGAKVNDLRHTWVAHHLAAGVPLHVVSKLAGHKRLTTTEKYLAFVQPKGENKVRFEEL